MLRIEYGAVILGAALGSVVRELVLPFLPNLDFMTSCFLINTVACFILGWLFSIHHRIHAHLTHFGAIGFCGGLSTFSTFTADVFQMLTNGVLIIGILVPILEIFVGIMAALVGETIGRRIHGRSVAT